MSWIKTSDERVVVWRGDIAALSNPGLNDFYLILKNTYGTSGESSQIAPVHLRITKTQYREITRYLCPKGI